MTLPTFLLILSGLLIGGMYVSAKVFSNEKFSPFTFTVVYSLISTLLALPIVGIRFSLPTDALHWILALLSPISFALGNMFGYKAYMNADASAVGLIGRSSIVVAAIMGVLLLGEHMTFFAIVGLILTAVGGSLMIYQKKRIVLSSGTTAALLMAFFYGLTAMLDKVVVEQFSPYTYVTFNNLIVFLTFFLTVPATRKELVTVLMSNPKLAILTSFLGTAGWLAFLYSIQSEFVAIAFPLSDTLSLITTVLLGIFLLREKENIAKKYVGMGLAIAGSFLLIF